MAIGEGIMHSNILPRSAIANALHWQLQEEWSFHKK